MTSFTFDWLNSYFHYYTFGLKLCYASTAVTPLYEGRTLCRIVYLTRNLLSYISKHKYMLRDHKPKGGNRFKQCSNLKYFKPSSRSKKGHLFKVDVTWTNFKKSNISPIPCSGQRHRFIMFIKSHRAVVNQTTLWWFTTNSRALNKTKWMNADVWPVFICDFMLVWYIHRRSDVQFNLTFLFPLVKLYTVITS